MTPTWRRHMRDYLTAKASWKHTQHEMQRWLVEARCFDLRGIEDLVWSTMHELSLAATDQGDKEMGTLVAFHELHVDVGPRTCVPAPHAWLEFSHGSALQAEEGVWFWFGTPNVAGRTTYQEPTVLGCIAINHGQAEVSRLTHYSAASVTHPVSVSYAGNWRGEEGVAFLFLILAACAVIASPHAERDPVGPHAGLARQVRALSDQTPQMQHSVVRLRGWAPGACEAGDAGTRRPKAYHFCRAHPRRKRDRVEQVRAHWRGDPAFGVRLPTYTALPGLGA